VKRSNGSVRVLKQTKVALTLDPLRDEPELAGREIRNILNQAQITTRRCVAGIPAQWALTVHCKIPPVEPEDVASFLELEAERGFACNVDELQTSSRIFESNGSQYATIVGVPRGYIERLEAVLVAAQLKPVSLSLGIAALPDALSGSVTVQIDDSRIDLLLGSPAGLVALRTIESPFDSEGAERRVQGEVLARELRITLGQLAPEVQKSISALNIFGDHRFAEQLLSDFQTRARILGLSARHFTDYPEKHHGVDISGQVPVTGAFSLATQHLSDTHKAFEFLPPKPTVWQQISTRYSSKRLGYAGAGAAIILLLIGAAFLYQQTQLSKYKSQWSGMQAKVTELQDLQGKIRRFRPWSHKDMATLHIMRRVTEAFPEDGVVSAKIIEIRDGNIISCIGTARDNSSLLATIDRLRSSEQVRNLRVDQIRGNAPLQFTFNFQWNESAAYEN
ncbi:MAG: hypothetical protein ACXW3L_07340, partial [Limisphaerales bacterium]